jgi:hypothetical protein
MRLFGESDNRALWVRAVAAALVGTTMSLAIPLSSSFAKDGGYATDLELSIISPEQLPSDHPIWADLEALWNRGGLTGLPIFTRPLVRADIVHAYLWTIDQRPEWSTLPEAIRVEREFARELARIRSVAQPPTKPMLSFKEGRAELRIQSIAGVLGRLTEDEGHIDEGTYAGLMFRADLSEHAHAAVDVVLERLLDPTNLGDSILKGSDWYFYTNLATLTVRTRFVDFWLGLDRNRWGPGSSGTLLLSDAAPSAPGLYYGRTFGSRARFTAMTASLQAPEHRWISAHRFEFSLHPRLRIGIQEAAAYFSDGIDILYAVNLIPYTVVQRILDRTSTTGASIAENRNNLMVGADLEWRFWDGWRFDTELLIDEFATESASQPHRLGGQAGVSWSGGLLGRSADARIEASKVYRATYAVFYGANFIQDDLPTGYFGAPDIEHALATLDVNVSTDLRVGVGMEAQRHGEGRPGDFWDPEDPQSKNAGADLEGVIERILFPHLRARATWRDIADVAVRAGVRDINNAGNDDSKDETGFFGDLVARWEW